MSSSGAIGNILKTTGGFVVGLTGVLTWMSISPEMVGQAVYDVLHIALPVVTFAGGALSGWGITKLRADRRLASAIGDKEKETGSVIEDKERRIKELEQRPTRDDLDSAVRAETARMMKRVDELTDKLADAYREIDYLKSGGKVMTEEQVSSLISNLPNSLKRRLREIESRGGSMRERKDGELSALEQFGILSSTLDDWVESRYVWSIVPDVRSVIKSNDGILTY